MLEMQQEILSTRELINRSSSVLLVSHRNVDGDAYGSTLALAFLLERIGKSVTIVNELPIAQQYHFLGFHGLVKSEIPNESFDCIIVCDCGELKMIGKFSEERETLFTSTPIVNIDHHTGNFMFGSINLFDPGASSTCEIIYNLIVNIPEYKERIDEKIATCLAYGIVRDTNCFRNSIRPATFAIIGELMNLGAQYREIIFQTYKSERLNYLQIYGEILDNLIILKQGKIIG